MLGVLQLFEDMARNRDAIIKIKSAFEKLKLMVRILTLDVPSDIRRCHLSGALVDEATVRQLLGNRIDFPKDVVAKVKVDIRD